MLGFARAQVFGRCGGMALHYLSAIVTGQVKELGPAGRQHLRFWPKHLSTAPPRQVRARDGRRPALIYTDGSEETEGVGIETVLLDPETSIPNDFMIGQPSKNGVEPNPGREAFGGMVPEVIVESWKSTGKKSRVIHQAELLPAKLALDLWAPRLEGRRVIVFIDNAAAEGALVRGASASEPSAQIVGRFWETATRFTLDVWIARVPSKSNPADGPSRGDWEWTDRWGFARVVPNSWSSRRNGGRTQDQERSETQQKRR